MKKFLVFGCLCLFALIAIGQDEMSTYEIKADSAVFRFNFDFIDDLLKDKSTIFHDFEETDFKSLIRSKSFEAWSENGWTLKHIEGSHFQLRKCLDDFMPFNWSGKYLVPSENWKYPRSETIEENEISTVNERIAEVSEEGNSVFLLKGFENAKKVILTGSFNNWDEHAIEMERRSDHWEITMALSPGIYEYKFIVDGNWHHDYENPLELKNEHQTLNSILLVGKEQRFFLKGYENSRKVVLSGSFNNWNEKAMKMQKTEGGWSLTITLPPGKHYYKFKLKNKWVLDTENPLIQEDGAGNTNSVLIIN